MTTFNQKSITELLRECLEKLPDTQEHTGKGVYIPGFVSAIARKWPAPLDQQDQKDLEILSRKADIARKVWTTYDVDWRKPIVHEPLAPLYMLLLIAVLLAYSLPVQNLLEDAKGNGLKKINTALNVLDLCENDGSTDYKKQLEACANFLIVEILDQ